MDSLEDEVDDEVQVEKRTSSPDIRIGQGRERANALEDSECTTSTN
ncbi:unnamed protein product [Penicillium camemberti]|uniref:Str. FM013 n=1 Tax=Penicillium camemberti (strain FM 013) TaxID=1429867 RepID=A0A0G4PGE1_PENC3|nr:unnamed protein product [Penicillium camemberti]